MRRSPVDAMTVVAVLLGVLAVAYTAVAVSIWVTYRRKFPSPDNPSDDT